MKAKAPATIYVRNGDAASVFWLKLPWGKDLAIDAGWIRSHLQESSGLGTVCDTITTSEPGVIRAVFEAAHSMIRPYITRNGAMLGEREPETSEDE